MAVLAATGDEDHLLDPRLARFVHRILDQRTIDDRQQLLGDCLGRGQEAGAEPRDGKHGLADGLVRHGTRLAGAGCGASMAHLPARPRRLTRLPMDKIIIRGGKRLAGALPISGAKNAALTLIPCALLTDEPLTLRNLPRLADIDGFQHLMTQFGVAVGIQGKRPEDFGRVVTFEGTRITSTVAPYELVRKMRASILVLGPMLARAGEATVSLPGGCAIGNRPIDLHLKALEAMGAQIELAQGYVRAYAPDGGLPGGDYDFPVVSVGATENALMTAVLANGTTRLTNAAREPEIVDLCRLLAAMGAEIEGVGTAELTVHGRRRLTGATYKVMPDRIEAGSYACAAAITGGEVRLDGAEAGDMAATLEALRRIGVTVSEDRDGVTVAANGAC